MWCPRCKEKETKVTDSRVARESLRVFDEGEHVLHAVIGKLEYIEVRFPKVVKKDGGRRQFNETKLRSGVSRALEKRPLSSSVF